MLTILVREQSEAFVSRSMSEFVGVALNCLQLIERVTVLCGGVLSVFT